MIISTFVMNLKLIIKNKFFMRTQLKVAVTILMILPLQLSGQEHYYAIKGGYNYSTLLNQEGTPQYSISSRSTFNLALVYSNKMRTLPIGFSIEPGYILKGTKIDHDTLDYKLHYINMPILFDFYPIERVKISAGPELAYLISARNLNDTITTDISNIYNKRWELSGAIGVSFSPVFFMDVGFRYNMAFNYAAREDELLNARNLYNKYLQVYLILKIAN